MARRGKKLSLDGSVPGIEYNRHHGGYNRSPFDGQLHIDRPHPQQVYNPDPGRMELPNADYQPYQWEMPHHHTPQFRLGEPEAPQVERPPSYNDCLMTDDLFQQAMRECIVEPPPEPIPIDHAARVTGVMIGPWFLADVVNDEMRADPCQEMVSALEQQVHEMDEQATAMEPPQPSPEEVAQQMFDEQMQQLMYGFGMPGPMGPMGPMM